MINIYDIVKTKNIICIVLYFFTLIFRCKISDKLSSTKIRNEFELPRLFVYLKLI